MAAEQDDAERVSVRVRNLSGSRVVRVETRLERSVVEYLKNVIAKKCNLPVHQQRLIYKGSILVNDRSIRSYGIKEGDTILMVHGSAPIRTASTPEIAPAATPVATDAEDSSDPNAFTDADSSDSDTFTDAGAIDSAIFIYFIHYCIGAILGSEEVHRLPENFETFCAMLHSFIMANPHVHEIIDLDPSIGHTLNETWFLWEAYEFARNPEMMPVMLKVTDETLRNIESSPEGFDMLRRMAVALVGDNEAELASDPLTALYRYANRSTPHDQTNHPSSSSAPNTNPLPNPWARSTVRSGRRILSPIRRVQSSRASGKSGNNMMSSDLSNLQHTTEGSLNASLMGQQSSRPVPNQQPSSQRAEMNGNATVPQEQLYVTQLSQLRDMGFHDTEENMRALQATAGDIQAAVEHLLRNMGR